MSELGGTIIDVALGLALVYLVLSLVVTGAQEWVAQLLRLRATNLREGIVNLIGEAKTSDFYQHGLIKGLYDHTTKTRILGRTKYPSYIPGERFADAILEIFHLPANEKEFAGSEPLATYIEKNVDAPKMLKEALKALARRGDTKIESFRNEIARWYDDSMDRVSGWYARKIRWIGLVVAAFVVITMNADSLRIAYTIWQSEALRASLAATATSIADRETLNIHQKEVDEILTMLPLGWPCVEAGEPPVCVFNAEILDSVGGVFLKLVGWLITVMAVSLGAPFWFDLLKRIARLRSGGRKPDLAPAKE
jgi:hypothetical protein